MARFSAIALYSTPHTVAANKITALAIAEALFMSSLLGAVIYFEWERYLPCTTLLSLLLFGPLLLLRTQRSTEIGLQSYDGVVQSVANVDRWQDTPGGSVAIRESRLFGGFFFFLVVVPIRLWFIRVASVFRAMFLERRFLESIFSIPSNWYRSVFVLDLCYPSEVVPAIEEKRPQGLYRPRQHFQDAFSHIRGEHKDRGLFFKVAYICAWMLQWIVLFVPGMILRLGLKSTFVLWLPVVGIVRLHSPQMRDFDLKSDDLLRSKLAKFGRWVVAPFYLVHNFVLPVAVIYFDQSSRFPPGIHWLVPSLFASIRWATGFDLETKTFVDVAILGPLTIIWALLTIFIFLFLDRLDRRERKLIYVPNNQRMPLYGLLVLRTLISAILIGIAVFDAYKILFSQSFARGWLCG